MSASERLTALWDDLSGISPGELQDVFPEIVAVVKAAELLLEEGRESVAPEYPNTLKSYWASYRSLAALEEKLKQ